ncbi:MAG: ATP-dependent DNA helicase RecG [Gammaproteobacteria bacterium]|nr:ATP-dependent DNA helicase RecG [Gammaproteobacteria bacterium]
MSGAAPETPAHELPLTLLRGVGSRVAEKLARLDLHNVQDLLFHLPLRYEDRTRITPLRAVRAGGEALVEGQIELAEIGFGRRRSLLVRIGDGTGLLTLRFFHFSGAQQSNLRSGRYIRCYGEVRHGPGMREMVHPEYQLFDAPPDPPEPRLTPVYPTTEGVHQVGLRNYIGQALDRFGASLADTLPPGFLDQHHLPALPGAVASVHRPPADADVDLLLAGRHPAQRRLALDEFLAHHLSLRRLRAARRAHPGPRIDGGGELAAAFLSRLPFALTGAQQRVIAEALADMASGKPMQRLLQGDVGAGKTVVAAIIALYAIEAGYQAAVMAPTEILAEQHYQTLSSWLLPLGVETAWLHGGLRTAPRRAARQGLASGRVALAIGTHALFQEEVRFRKLGLLVVDEQHRFGVDQRLALREKGRSDEGEPHQLIMTATPIPRTLAMTAYADLDVSLLDELPPGRLPVETVAVSELRRAQVIERVGSACAAGHQAYWVCPLIDESEQVDARAAMVTAEELQGHFPHIAIGVVHGRMSSEDKEAVVARFKAGDISLLVATTVIEVGVDVPNATLMIIENAERLGLSQLHQLRGRVGRGKARSTCVLLYHSPLSEHARERLAVLRATNDGFAIARKDLELRGPGEVLGTRQTGLQNLKVANLVRDRDLLPLVENLARRLLEDEPQWVEPLIRRWLGGQERYGKV